MIIRTLLVLISVLMPVSAHALDAKWDRNAPLPFGVINQRSIALTAGYWNPILAYVSRRSGVPLQLRMAKTAPETTGMSVRGELAFVYSNHLFTPERDALGFVVIARPEESAIRGQIVVVDDSALKSIADLEGKDVAFPSQEAFVGYQVPNAALERAGVTVKPVFSGNQEAAMAQLRFGKVAAAGVNDRIMATYGEREGVRYRALYSSDAFQSIPILAHPGVPAATRMKVQAAFVGMMKDPEGAEILRVASDAIGKSKASGFVASSNEDYENYRRFYHGLTAAR
jgi:phosphonate transport system substrate-binding protein